MGPLGWLVGYTLGSMAAAFVVVRIFDALVSEAGNSVTSAARATVFINTWAAVTGRSGMHGISKTVQRFRLSNDVAKEQIESFAKDALPKDERR